ncbi:hypothetical protein X975_10521, partial [Stegodyphus mimosarum]
MTIVVTHSYNSFKSCALTSSCLFLYRHNFHYIILKSTAKKEIYDFTFFYR